MIKVQYKFDTNEYLEGNLIMRPNRECTVVSNDKQWHYDILMIKPMEGMDSDTMAIEAVIHPVRCTTLYVPERSLNPNPNQVKTLSLKLKREEYLKLPDSNRLKLILQTWQKAIDEDKKKD